MQLHFSCNYQAMGRRKDLYLSDGSIPFYSFQSTHLWLHGKAHGREGPHMMSSLIDTSYLQLASFALGTVGWILCTIAMGLVEWRVWHVDNTTIISSGIAWVGIWKVCFISYTHVSPGYEEQFCHKFSGYDSSIPGEIYAAQGLLVIAMVMGLLGLTATICALRNIYMGISHKTAIIRFFLVGGFFYVFAGLCVLIPVSYNFYSVTQNQSIAFPPSYLMPSSPVAQEAGAAIPIGIIAAILLLLSGIFSLSYRFPATTNT
ncbi:claudin-34 [Centrocercus urophasianus]|uniref:claudin-34 n=1 Tax=Centrocercus urophasianus TaxID=9002 RepID=UPI001C6486B1|nr:claudin-34 [Centrocercus urophasianus]